MEAKELVSGEGCQRAGWMAGWLEIIGGVLLIVVACLFVPLLVGSGVLWFDLTFLGGHINQFWAVRGLLRTQEWYWWVSVVMTGLPFVLLFFAVNWWKKRWTAPDDRLGGSENIDD